MSTDCVRNSHLTSLRLLVYALQIYLIIYKNTNFQHIFFKMVKPRNTP